MKVKLCMKTTVWNISGNSADIKKEVIAFANSGGGIIYVGCDDEGNPYPLSNIDETLTQITNSTRDSILKPCPSARGKTQAKITA